MGNGGGSQTVTQVPSEQQNQAFQFRLNQAQGAINNLPGGSGYFTSPGNNPWTLSPQQQTAIQGVQQAAGNQPPDPLANWAMQSYPGAAGALWSSASAPNPMFGQWNSGANALAQHLVNTPIAGMNGWQQGAMAGAQMAQAPIATGQMNYGAGGIDYQATPSAYGAVGVGTQAPVTVRQLDPTAAIGSARNTLDTISAPAIRNALQASGLGRSGAEAQALAQEGTRLELPIQQQVLASQAQANQLDAQMKARQQEVELLEQQKAALQAQQLTATSREMAQQINGQLAGIEGQIQGRLAEAEFMGQVQANIAQRTSGLQYGSSVLGQLAGMNTAQQQLVAGSGTTLLGQLGQMGTAQQQGQNQVGSSILQNLTGMGLAIPGLQSQQYQNALTGAQTNLQAASLPQQMQQAQWQNLQNYILSLIGATPLPSQTYGGAQQTQQNPGVLNTAGNLALIGSLFA